MPIHDSFSCRLTLTTCQPYLMAVRRLLGFLGLLGIFDLSKEVNLIAFVELAATVCPVQIHWHRHCERECSTEDESIPSALVHSCKSSHKDYDQQHSCPRVRAVSWKITTTVNDPLNGSHRILSPSWSVGKGLPCDQCPTHHRTNQAIVR